MAYNALLPKSKCRYSLVYFVLNSCFVSCALALSNTCIAYHVSISESAAIYDLWHALPKFFRKSMFTFVIINPGLSLRKFSFQANELTINLAIRLCNCSKRQKVYTPYNIKTISLLLLSLKTVFLCNILSCRSIYISLLISASFIKVLNFVTICTVC